MPLPGPGVCRVCRGPAEASHGVCFCCRVVARRLGLPLAPVSPARLCPLPSDLYSVLLGYKESPVAEVRRHHFGAVRALVREALSAGVRDLARLMGGRIELVAPVPSTSRPGPAVLAQVPGIDRVVAAALPRASWEPALLHRSAPAGSGARPVLGHMHPHRAGFSIDPRRPGRTVVRRALLLDDLYVSGARAQSAAAALRRAGMAAVVIVPLGRVLRPDRIATHAAFLARHLRRDGEPAEECPASPRQ